MTGVVLVDWVSVVHCRAGQQAGVAFDNLECRADISVPIRCI